MKLTRKIGTTYSDMQRSYHYSKKILTTKTAGSAREIPTRIKIILFIINTFNRYKVEKNIFMHSQSFAFIIPTYDTFYVVVTV